MPFRIALSGLNAASNELKVTGNNIANAATVGFKRSRSEFADVYAVSFGGTTDASTGNGVRVATVSQQFTQGSIDFTDRALDVAVSGQGFFVVEDSAGRAYTRNGSFLVDAGGTVINNHNQRLQVFPVVGNTIPATFNTGLLSDLQLATTNGPPASTTDVTAGLNLDAAATPPTTVPFDPTDATSYNSSTSLIVYDSLGAQHTASMYYVKTAVPNQWQSYLYVDGNQILTDAAAVPASASPITMTFNPDGTLATPTTMQYAPIVTTTGSSPISLNYNYSTTTQFGGQFAINTLNQNGFSSGRLSGLDIDDEGVVFARYTNGQSSALGKVALANFPNPEGLRQLGLTNWSETFDSGNAILGEAGTGSLGLMQSGALEASNVDIAASLVSLITSQRNFQANAQVISTADTITQTIINI